MDAEDELHARIAARVAARRGGRAAEQDQHLLDSLLADTGEGHDADVDAEASLAAAPLTPVRPWLSAGSVSNRPDRASRPRVNQVNIPALAVPEADPRQALNPQRPWLARAEELDVDLPVEDSGLVEDSGPVEPAETVATAVVAAGAPTVSALTPDRPWLRRTRPDSESTSGGPKSELPATTSGGRLRQREPSQPESVLQPLAADLAAAAPPSTRRTFGGPRPQSPATPSSADQPPVAQDTTVEALAGVAAAGEALAIEVAAGADPDTTIEPSTTEPVGEPVPAARPRPKPGRQVRHPEPAAEVAAAGVAIAGVALAEPRRPRPGPGTRPADPPATKSAGIATATPTALTRTSRPGTGRSQPGQAPGWLERTTADEAAAEAADRAEEQAADRAKRDKRSTQIRRRVRTGIKLGVFLTIAVVAAALLRVFVVAPYYIPSASMEPTLHGCSGCNNDHVLVDKITYRTHDPQRGDIVVFNRPAAWTVTEKVLIKRVIGLPGDTLTVKSGKLYVNGQLQDESYTNPVCPAMTSLGESPHPATTKIGPIPGGDVFVMGDNRCDSSDSRAFGVVPESSIIGRAFVIIWPLGDLHWL